MTKRRKLTIRTEAGNRVSDMVSRSERTRALISDRFGTILSVQQIESFVEAMQQAGYTDNDMRSMAKQYTTTGRGEVPAALHHNEHTLDVMMRNQASWTDFTDTGSSPNFAIRMKGETELIIRRFSLGDSILMKAAHNISAMHNRDETPSSRNPNYWKELWIGISSDIIQNGHLIDKLGDDPMRVSACALHFAMTRYSDATSGQIIERFCVEGRPFYCGVKARRERARQLGTEEYIDCWVFHHIEETENLWELAVTAILWGIDRTYLEQHWGGGHTKPSEAFERWLGMQRTLPSYLDAVTNDSYNDANAANWELEAEHRPDEVEGLNLTITRQSRPSNTEYHEPPEQPNANQETDDTAPTATVNPSRLLP